VKYADLIGNIGRLRTTLLHLESSVGFDDLTDAERNVLCAVSMVANQESVSFLKEIEANEMVAVMPQSTVFRVLRTLCEKGYLKRTDASRKAGYVVIDKGILR
jgi:predicted transcriptional regulator